MQNLPVNNFEKMVMCVCLYVSMFLKAQWTLLINFISRQYR